MSISKESAYHSIGFLMGVFIVLKDSKVLTEEKLQIIDKHLANLVSRMSELEEINKK